MLIILSVPEPPVFWDVVSDKSIDIPELTVDRFSVSTPDPPSIKSFPASAKMISAPLPDFIVLLAEFPFIISLKLEPITPSILDS
jgi:hypothetical protein